MLLHTFANRYKLKDREKIVKECACQSKVKFIFFFLPFYILIF
jgi:hypothetical protein